MAEAIDVVILGGGPAGYACALKAAQLGLKPAVVEKRPALGGTCLNVGCIPSKALLDSSERFAEMRKLERHGILVSDVRLDLARMLARKDQVVRELTNGLAGLFRKGKIEWVRGSGRLVAPGRVVVTTEGQNRELSARAVVIATGSEPASLPGVELDGKFVVSSTEALSFDSVPERLVVIGAGYIGLELGSVWSRLGSQVTILEFLPRILPTADAEMAAMVQTSLTRQGLTFHLGTKVTQVRVEAGRVIVTADQQGSPQQFTADKVLVAVGRRPSTAGLGLEELGIRTQPRTGKIEVDRRTYLTNVPGIYAIGDVIDGPMLAHKAQMEGEALAEMLVGHAAYVNYDAIPGVVYIWPELANVGWTEEQLKEQGRAYRVGKFPFLANGRAKALDETEGVVKVLTDGKTDRLLGVHIFGPRASDMIAEAVAVMEYSGSGEDLARFCHSHPSLSEALGEAARHAAFGKPLHL
ncbi:MAG: dihydrolipoyl dehydrogenase [Gemmataceae bacterium]|nr:dihydrolipoyl dehydrogenase [Gemmataceae bacterium]